jgi:hypothetical protein
VVEFFHGVEILLQGILLSMDHVQDDERGVEFVAGLEDIGVVGALLELSDEGVPDGPVTLFAVGEGKERRI